MFENKRILVTGGTGSWGYELVAQLLPQQPKEIIVYSRNESSQVAMSREFEDPRLHFRIGDMPACGLCISSGGAQACSGV